MLLANPLAFAVCFRVVCSCVCVFGFGGGLFFWPCLFVFLCCPFSFRQQLLGQAALQESPPRNRRGGFPGTCPAPGAGARIAAGAALTRRLPRRARGRRQDDDDDDDEQGHGDGDGGGCVDGNGARVQGKMKMTATIRR